MNILNRIVPRLSRSSAQKSATAVADGAENGGLAVKPVFEIEEMPEAWGLQVQLPGVTKENLDITAENETVAISGQRTWKVPTGWAALHRETADVPYKLVIEHNNNVDVAKIAAELKDGVLHVSLPKTEALKPRKVPIG